MVEISGVNINLHLSTLSPLMSLISLISLASLTSHISHLSNLSHPLIPRILSPTTQYPSPLLSLSPFPSHPSYPSHSSPGSSCCATACAIVHPVQERLEARLRPESSSPSTRGGSHSGMAATRWQPNRADTD